MDRQIEKKPLMSNPVKWSLGTVILCTLGFVLANPSSGKSYRVDKDKITLSKVAMGQFNDSIPIRGNIMPIKTVYLDAIEGGRVEKRFLEEGALVKAGDKILELSNSGLQLEVISREAQISEQLNNLHNTRLAIDQNRLALKRNLLEVDYQLKELTRKQKQNESLLAKKLISLDEYQAVEDRLHYLTNSRALTIEQQVQDEKIRNAQMTQLEDSVGQLNRNLEVTRKNLEHLIVRAPVDGQLTSLDVELGESKSRGQRLGQIDIMDDFKVTAMVDEFYIGRVKPGLNATFELQGKSYQLELIKVYSQITAGRFEVDLQFVDKAPNVIRRGQSLQISLHLGESLETLLVDNGGFYQNTGGNWIFVVDDESQQAVKRNIKLGRRNNRVIEVISGLSANEQVITSSYGKFASMDIIKIQN